MHTQPMIIKHCTLCTIWCIIINVGGNNYAVNTYDAVVLVKEYRMAFKSGNVWYKRGE